jgi:hypothetical protein
MFWVWEESRVAQKGMILSSHNNVLCVFLNVILGNPILRMVFYNVVFFFIKQPSHGKSWVSLGRSHSIHQVMLKEKLLPGPCGPVARSRRGEWFWVLGWFWVIPIGELQYVASNSAFKGHLKDIWGIFEFRHRNMGMVCLQEMGMYRSCISCLGDQ